MSSLPFQIDSYEQIKGYAARMGTILFGVRFKTPVPDRTHSLELGVAVCDIVAKGKKLATSQPTRLDDMELRDEFISVAERKHIPPEKIAELADAAVSVGKILEELRDMRPVTDEEVDKSIAFFKTLYRYS